MDFSATWCVDCLQSAGILRAPWPLKLSSCMAGTCANSRYLRFGHTTLAVYGTIGRDMGGTSSKFAAKGETCATQLCHVRFAGAQTLSRVNSGCCVISSPKTERDATWLWVKIRYPKWNPSKWKLEPAGPWWFHFDPYPHGAELSPSLAKGPEAGATEMQLACYLGLQQARGFGCVTP